MAEEIIEAPYPVVLYYQSAFGSFVIPRDVEMRAERLNRRFGRASYLAEWCRWQWQQRFSTKEVQAGAK